MKRTYILVAILLGLFFPLEEVFADPTKYPQFAQLKNITPDFIYLDRLVEEILQRKRPMIIDVRSREEYEQSHIKGSVSIPLSEISLHLAQIPKDRPVTLY